MDRPLHGVRVLDASTMIAAPTTAALLADYGADVLKLEHPKNGDHGRRYGAAKNGVGIYWKSLARNKRSVALDLHDPEIVALLLRWLPRFDVFIENFRPGTLEKWGLGPDVLLAAAPHLVVLRVTAFGQDGPYRDYPGFGTLCEAMSGFPSMNGWDDRPPLLPPLALADMMAGFLGASAVNAALVRARETRRGDVIDLAIYETMLKLVETNLMEYDQLGVVPRRLGNRTENTAPRGAYLCRDGAWMVLSGSAQPIAERILRAIGGEDLVHDPRFATNASRLEHGEELDALISAWALLRDRDVAVEELRGFGAAAGPLETIASAFDNPQVVARGSMTRVEDPTLGPLRMVGPIPRFERTPQAPVTPGPTAIGAQTRAVLLEELGLDEAALAALAERGAIGLGD
jgi:crotonobetainyl-CoA:carnitine CoA-transferase CaiB-like acyl-CoA transferase